VTGSAHWPAGLGAHHPTSLCAVLSRQTMPEADDEATSAFLQLVNHLSATRGLIKIVTDQSGATAIEYGLITAGISIAIIATGQAIGTSLDTPFSSVSSALK
jgi:pilus assembly protein Flp/PilA